jgi:hypothetical protein
MVTPGYTGTGVEPIPAATIYRALFRQSVVLAGGLAMTCDQVDGDE